MHSFLKLQFADTAIHHDVLDKILTCLIVHDYDGYTKGYPSVPVTCDSEWLVKAYDPL